MSTRIAQGLGVAFSVAWVALIAALALIGPAWFDYYRRVGYCLPVLTEHALAAMDVIRTPTGFVMGPFLGLAMLPLPVLGDTRAVRAWFVLGVMQAGLAALLLRCALVLFPPPEGRLLEVMSPGIIGAMIVVALGQLTAWIVMTRTILALPRGPAAEAEVGRAALIATIPGLVLAAGLLALEVVGPAVGPSDAALLPRPVATAGTALLVVYGCALWFRLRRPAA